MNSNELFSALIRKKRADCDETSHLARVLNLYDLTALGVGSTLGAGVYVLTGAVAKETSGPSVVIAFLIAAVTSVLSGLCYAEFGARVPKAGSGYVYSYVTVGELCAFVIGWNLILSYVIGAASVARAWTANFDAMIGGKLHAIMLECCSINSPGLSAYPDVFSFVIIMLLTSLIAFGVKEFATVNKIFTVLNIFVILFVVIAGYTQADLDNWSLSPEEIVNISLANNMTNVTTSTYGDGGFMPYGFSGLISGTATCFYAFVGFDCIATTGEEAKNPQKNIPLGIVFSLIICCVAYLGVSSAMTLMQPYFLLDRDAPLPYAFHYVGMEWAVYIVSIGAICALSTSLLGAMFPLPRIVYAMALDGLLFKQLAAVNKKTKTPQVATFLSGILAGIMAMLFDLKELVDLMSIGTLASYTIVAQSVLLLRYQEKEEDTTLVENDTTNANTSTVSLHPIDEFKLSKLFQPGTDTPSKISACIVDWTSFVLVVAMICFSVTVDISYVSGAIFGCIIIFSVFVIYAQPQSCVELTFKVPMVPLLPLVNMFVNIYLMVSLPESTWHKLLVWMAVGFLEYFFYGIWHSVERKPKRVFSVQYSSQEDLKISEN